MSYDFDLFVIGGGSGGISTARRAAEYGAKVGIAEFDDLGGTCVNRGCIPKKLMVYASGFPDLFEEAEGYGWSPVSSQIDWKKMITAVNQEVERLNGIYKKMLDNSNVEIIRGFARFIDHHTVEIGDRKVTADKILIAVGAHPVKPDIPGIEHAIVSDDVFHLPQQPKNIVIFGGGYIGVEFACIMNKLGSKVNLVLRSGQILTGFDDDLRDSIAEAMERDGIKIHRNSEPKSIEKTDRGYKINLKGDSELSIDADAVTLAATGRIPKIENLGLENTSVEVDDGSIAVDKYNQTTVKNIYAVGDCSNQHNLTPVAITEGRAFADTKFGGKSRTVSYENIPTAVFSSPEAATVGLTESEARDKYGDDIKIYRSKFRPMYYVLPDKQEKTMMKLVVNQKTDQVLGAHMVGDHAAEIIQGVAIAVKMGAKKADFDATVGIHPSSAEEFVTMR